MELNWLAGIFSQILHMSMTAGIIICAVLGIRLCLRRAPKIFSYLLWSVVLFRLLCPVALPSRFSAFGMWQTFEIPNESAAGTLQSAYPKGIPHSGQSVMNIQPSAPEETSGSQSQTAADGLLQELSGRTPSAAGAADMEASVLWVLGVIWLLGMVCIAGYGIFCTIRLKKRLADAVCAQDNIYISDAIDTPFTMGIFAPKIYLPAFLSEKEKGYIILHEQTHIRRGDPFIKLLAFAALTVHWFHPLVWIAFLAAEKDMEMSCDEMVMKKMKEDIRAEYSTSLLCLATGKTVICGTPLAFGEGSTKRRVKNIMHYKKPAALVVCIAAAFVIVFLIAFGTNPDGNDTEALADTRQGNTEGGVEAADAESAGAKAEGAADAESAEAKAAGTADTGSAEAKAAETEAENPAVLQAAEVWAKAYCSRDGNTIAAMSTKAVQDQLKSANLLDEAGRGYTFGISSPWPQKEDFRIVESAGLHTEILYYATRTSELRVCVWRETLEFTKQQDTYIVETEQLEILEGIRTGAEYERAYPNGLYGTPMDYLWDGTAQALGGQHSLLSSRISYKDLSDPAEAAVYLLNIDKNYVEAKAGDVNKDGSVRVDLTFQDDIAAAVRMVQVFPEAKEIDGMTVWIPQDEEEAGGSEHLLHTEYNFLGNMGSERVWLEGTDAKGNGERVIYSVAADITHDGIKDRIDLLIDTSDPEISPVSYIQGMGMAYIKAYEGQADGSFGEDAVYVSGEVAHSHATNGQIGLVKKDGQEYLLISSMYEGQGRAEYRFAVFYPDVEQKAVVCVDEGLTEFRVSEEDEDVSVREESLKQDEVVDFRKRLESWTEDGMLFVSCDLWAEQEILISEMGDECGASEYYDSVWDRD